VIKREEEESQISDNSKLPRGTCSQSKPYRAQGSLSASSHLKSRLTASFVASLASLAFSSLIITMSTPPPVAELQSPITSPLPKRTKTAHKPSNSISNGTMASIANTSEPTNVPVAVTRVQDGPHLLIKKLSDKAKLPTRGSAFAAGYDLYAAKETTIPSRGKGLVNTDLSMAVPAGTCLSP